MTRSPWLLALAPLGALLLLWVAAAPPAAAATSAPDVPVDAPEPDVTGDVADLDEETVWHGQVVRVEGLQSDEPVAVRSDAGEHQYAADGTGAVQVDTAQLAPGDWTIVGRESGERASLHLREQSLEASFDPATTDGVATLALSSNRESYDVEVSVAGVDEAWAEHGVDEDRLEDGRYVRSVEGRNATVTVDSTGCRWPRGDLEVVLAVTDANATARTGLEVHRVGLAGELSVPEDAYHVGDRVPVRVSATSRRPHFWIGVGADRSRPRLAAEVTDLGSCREPTEITWNTHRSFAGDGSLGAENGRILAVNASGAPDDRAVDRAHLAGDVEHSVALELVTEESLLGDDAGTHADAATVDLRPRRVDGLAVRGVPAEHGLPRDGDDLGAVRDAASADGSVAAGELLLAEVNASGSFGFVEPTPAGLDRAGLSLTFQRDGDDTGDGAVVDVADPEVADDAAVVHAPDGDGFAVVVDAGALAGATGAGVGEGGQRWTATLSREEEHPYDGYAAWNGTASFRLEGTTDDADEADGGAGPREDDSGAADDAVPGFGALAAVLGLASVGLIAGRRRTARGNGRSRAR